ncbi:MAG: OmpA family protein [Prevotella sp.]|nr:OmpA family protein [Prevotella sp.]
MKVKAFSIALCFGIVLAGCNNLQKGAAIGAGGGAVLGGIIGKIAGNTAVGAAIGAAVGTGAGALIGKKMDRVRAEAERIRNAEVTEVTDANGLDAVKVTFDSNLLFATGASALSAESKTSLQELAKVLKNNTSCDVAIQGYTDNQGWRGATAAQSVEKNKALSLDRAAAVSTYLQSLGVETRQIKSVEGLGEANPVADNATDAGRQQNRRVEIYIYASQEMISSAEAGGQL